MVIRNLRYLGRDVKKEETQMFKGSTLLCLFLSGIKFLFGSPSVASNTVYLLRALALIPLVQISP